ncbi:helix-turn-helix domain-containing protein [Paracidobacterium acidisoli]|uniref:DNA-binding protein n=1 Tax=Paracidobacterium acidisoli TaxID=2303751 RepID=A0A372IQ95_9BACT|nr:helix-turn-helix domain-containing protein [Paracidobacterium acidisoli]MBT9331490.1 helix-turn-helix domain-containing protein [Paracidobacterium acidisoli]
MPKQAAVKQLDDLLTVTKAARELHLSVWGLRRAIRERRIGSYKVLGRVLVSKQEINRIITEGERPRIAV